MQTVFLNATDSCIGNFLSLLAIIAAEVYNFIMNNLSNNLITLRKNNNFTQDDIAEKMYVSRQAVSKWERGESIPDVETLVALSEFYGVTIDDLLKSDLSASKQKSAAANIEKIFGRLKNFRKKQNAKLMIIWAVLLLSGYALIC